MYRLFDLCIDSELVLPDLPSWRDRSPDWSFTLLDQEADSRGFEVYHAWKDADGQEVMSAACRGADYLLDFAGLARFAIDFEARCVGARPAPGCTDLTLAHLLVDQVFPRVVCHEGRLVLHASAVGMADGGAIAFVGGSGRGKSTLASACYGAGYRLLGDDCLLIEKGNGELRAVPPYPSMRLWPDSAAALFPGDLPGGLQASRMAHYTNKKVLSPGRQTGLAKAVSLRALFLLEPPGTLQIEAASGMAAIMAMVEAQFALDVVSQNAVRRGFSAVRRVAGHVPVFRLIYPREYGALKEVIEAVIDATARCATAERAQA